MFAKAARLGGEGYDCIALTGACRDGCLAEVVGSPCVHGAVLVDSKGMINSDTNVANVGRKSTLVGNQVVSLAVAACAASSKLVLFIAAPAENSIIGCQC